MANTRQLLPVNRIKVATRPCVSVASVLLFGFVPPPISMLCYLIKTMIMDFKTANVTHCDVLNIFPSLSSVAQARQFGMKVITWFHFPFRLFVIYLYWRYYRRVFPRRKQPVSWLILALLLHDTINTVLMAHMAHIRGHTHQMLAYSIFTSGCGYIIVTLLSYRCSRCQPMELHELLSYVLKRRLATMYFCSLIVMFVCFKLHTEFCLPLVYSVFALGEYVVNWSLLGYMLTSYLDFYPVYICLDDRFGFFLQTL